MIKKIIQQTLLIKHKAHPSKVPCCKLNIFFTDFNHKKDCDGVLYVGELNRKVIIVCEKCKAINFYNKKGELDGCIIKVKNQFNMNYYIVINSEKTFLRDSSIKCFELIPTLQKDKSTRIKELEKLKV